MALSSENRLQGGFVIQARVKYMQCRWRIQTRRRQMAAPIARVTLVMLLTGTTAVGAPLPESVRLGGGTTVNVIGSNAFSLPAANLSLAKRLDFSVGNSFFRSPWVVAPSSTDARDGLGPLFNTNACQNCHIKDGRGHPPGDAATHAVSLLARLSMPLTTPADVEVARTLGVVPVPAYGTQLQDMAVPGLLPEARIRLRWQEHEVVLADGKRVALRQPQLDLGKLAYGPLPAGTRLSVRVAPPMIGLGLLEAIPDTTLLSLADPDDANNDGISGRVNQVWDIQRGRTVPGRFGWKAGQPTLDQQNAAAFAGDMGLTNRIFARDDCTAVQTDCRNAPQGGTPEVSNEIRRHVLFYSRHLAVPAQRNGTHETVQTGREIFMQVGCAACHVPSHVTASQGVEPALGQQTIWPYTDLLLHDMGDGLADGFTEFAADGREWRTPPLWGVGLAQQVNPQAGYLHDGRARTLLEAILWHGGEAQTAKAAVIALPAAARNALLQFLDSL